MAVHRPTIASATGVTDLWRALAIDPGYLSRILARFQADGLITRRRSAADGRRQAGQHWSGALPRGAAGRCCAAPTGYGRSGTWPGT
jgi:hypothetical protein